MLSPACVAVLKKGKRKGSPKGCVVILNEYKLQRGAHGATPWDEASTLGLSQSKKKMRGLLSRLPMAGFSLEVKKLSYVGAEGCKVFDNPVDVMQVSRRPQLNSANQHLPP